MKLITNRKPGYSKSRSDQTIAFCMIPTGTKVLDIAEPNELSKKMAIAKNVFVVNTTSDLDYDIKPEKKGTFSYVTCFEVIEHLMNPRMFFDNLYNITTNDVVLYLSYPSRPKFLWNDDEHFHEYDRLRFDYLLEKTGWMVVREKNIYVHRPPIGIRPIIRNFLPQTTVYEIHKK
jgi:hypothetical protein